MNTVQSPPTKKLFLAYHCLWRRCCRASVDSFLIRSRTSSATTGGSDSLFRQPHCVGNLAGHGSFPGAAFFPFWNEAMGGSAPFEGATPPSCVLLPDKIGKM